MKQFSYALITVLMALGLYLPNHLHAEMSYFSVAQNGSIMYDAPSLKAGKIYVASQYLPVETIVDVEGWSKVRDSSGTLAWIEKKGLSDKRYVIVTVPVASVYQTPDANAVSLFQAERNVVMEWIDSDNPGWVKVRHQDGQTGYVKSIQVWGS
ncbi:MAG TPA: SH3 domain-containing protein [Nitrosomonas sp.]|nr:SH3 domain-containing protein [Nitrosomonas sp.]HQX13847.1 SH3 domain-containing protein [Nitrosomonas sp.]HRB20985.1 SH3 domain-containing protein [Nitrosomonas sp.]HRB33280.1 SH3 domain-containing protein [Nitrosomonas sp.]HRB45743.1 SH3 domain-containing protein [Nitrosomonas sp.]